MRPLLAALPLLLSACAAVQAPPRTAAVPDYGYNLRGRLAVMSSIRDARDECRGQDANCLQPRILARIDQARQQEGDAWHADPDTLQRDRAVFAAAYARADEDCRDSGSEECQLDRLVFRLREELARQELPPPPPLAPVAGA